ncbi:MAG: hypothetical protein ACKVTZ_11960 [Bacteroidia bacterium]
MKNGIAILFLFLLTHLGVHELQAQTEAMQQTILYFNTGVSNLSLDNEEVIEYLFREFKKTDTLALDVYGFQDDNTAGILEKRAASISDYIKSKKRVVKAVHVFQGHEFLKKTAQNRKVYLVVRKYGDQDKVKTPATVTEPTFASAEPVIESVLPPNQRGEKDMTFVTESGVKVIIPANAFYPQKIRNFDIEVLSFSNTCMLPDSIVMQDMDENCMVSHGVVLINIYDNEGYIIYPELYKPITLQIPTMNLDRNLYVYKGIPSENNRIIWDKTDKELVVTVGNKNYYNFEVNITGAYCIARTVPSVMCRIDELSKSKDAYHIRNDAFQITNNPSFKLYSTYINYPIPFDVGKEEGITNSFWVGKISAPDSTYLIGAVEGKVITEGEEGKTCRIFYINKALSDLIYDSRKKIYIIGKDDWVDITGQCGELPSACDIMKLRGKKRKTTE